MSCSHVPLNSQSQLLPLLSPGGQRQYHLGFACGKSWDKRPGNETVGIGSLGMSSYMAKTGIGGLGSKAVISKAVIRGRNWE